jgi:FlaA1/EpsC-like NDP-sugar epimerase
LFLISISYYLAFWIHFGTQEDILNLDIFLSSLPIALASAYISFFVFGIYRGVWQYLDIRDLLRYGRAAVGAVLLTAGIMSWVYYPLAISYRIFVIFAILLFLGLVLSRSSFTILDRIYTQQIHDQRWDTPVLIYGSGEDSVILLQWLAKDTSHHLQPIGLIDDDPYIQGRQILGLRVLGTSQDLESVLENARFEGILISNERLMDPDRLSRLKEVSQVNGIWLKTLRIDFDSVE